MTGDEFRPADEQRPSGASPPADDLAPVVQTVVDAIPSGRALDVATGTGRNALALAARDWTVDAVDISSAKLHRARARERTAERSTTVNWILADVDRYCVRESVYDLVTVSFFDARDRLPSLIAALAPGGILCYEHYLESPAGESGPGDDYRFEPNELLTACADLSILYYAEHRVDGEPRVTLVARNEHDVARWRPSLPSVQR